MNQVAPEALKAMDPVHLSTPHPSGQIDPRQDRQALGRVAAGIWAAIAFFGALATVEPLRFPDTDVSAMRLVVLSAVTIAAVTFALPWRRMPKGLLNVVLFLMSCHISALAYASGAVDNHVTLLFTLIAPLAACFLPVRTSVAQVSLIAVLLTAGLVMLDKDNAEIAALRATLLFAMLVVLCGLVLILRAVMTEREAHLQRSQAFQAGLLDSRGLSRLIDRELSRAARHARPLALVMLDISGRLAEEQADGPRSDRLVTMLARSILGRIRAEDGAAHVDRLRFAIVAPETDAAGAASIAETVADVVRRRLVTLGYESATFELAVGWADYPHHAQSRAELLEAASADLQAAILRNETSPARADHGAAATRHHPATAGPN
jgi:diguanylate cyclase (GGDEF)-like protein